MSHPGQVVEHENAILLSSETDEHSAHIPVGDEETEPWANIQIDTWREAQGFVIDWPTKLGIEGFKELFPPEEGRLAWDAVVAFYHDGTRVEMESTYEYIHSELEEPDEWESFRLIDGPNECALFVTSEEEPNRFELKSNDGDGELFEQIFEHSYPVIPAKGLSVDEIKQTIKQRIL